MPLYIDGKHIMTANRSNTNVNTIAIIPTTISVITIVYTTFINIFEGLDVKGSKLGSNLNLKLRYTYSAHNITTKKIHITQNANQNHLTTSPK